MAKQGNITNNVVVQIDDEILKQLLEKISNLQAQINMLQLSQVSLQSNYDILKVSGVFQ